VEARTLTIRRARAADTEALARLAFASKLHWGYDAAFMERVRPALTPSAQYVENEPVFVIETGGAELVGFYGFTRREGVVFLEDMWVHPRQIGTGIGRLMWQHALETARAEGFARFMIESDPNAETFYLHCGARRAGEMVSPATGRVVPLLRADVA
jgi:GNAT superfamily N-acetyltransferase